MKFRWMVWNGMKKYVLVWNFSKITYWYILVYTGMTDITVYGRLSRFMMVWNDWNKYIQVHTSISLYMIVSGLHQTSTYWYILVHPCDMNVHTLINWSLLPVHPAGPPESSGFAASKRHTSSHTHTSLFKFGSDYLPSRLRWPVGAGRKCRQWAGPLPTLHCQILCPGPTGISAMLHWC